jgi:hypothetical protein
MRLLRAANRVWAVSWSLSMIGILTGVWDWIVDRFLVPRNRS